MTFRLSRRAACASLALAAALSAQAAPNADVQACRGDFTKFCSGVQPGGGRVVECLKQHDSELAPACHATVDKLGVCGPEIRRICGDAAGRDAMVACMKAHENEFSATCRAAAPAH